MEKHRKNDSSGGSPVLYWRRFIFIYTRSLITLYISTVVSCLQQISNLVITCSTNCVAQHSTSERHTTNKFSSWRKTPIPVQGETSSNFDHNFFGGWVGMMKRLQSDVNKSNSVIQVLLVEVPSRTAVQAETSTNSCYNFFRGRYRMMKPF